MKPRPHKPGPGAGNSASDSAAVSPGRAAQSRPGADEGAAQGSDWLQERRHDGTPPPPGVDVSSEAEQARNKARVRESKRGSY
ncbi:hypothetical protein [Methylibium rhizosphaerae]|uniref:hypothetical protein n=1 Tax=Methylibium rhizosphaerae TaxID=2570323 RepID=UPI00112CC58F|nr:hypothetical protein [Methylibium rhizosphaerae]